jgi:signal transduction histidine kinase
LVRADIRRIAQLISNLSKKKTKKKNSGTVTLDIENRVRAGGPNKIDREIVVSISDEGEGIDSIIVPSLFFKIVSAHFKRDRFRSVYVQSIVEAHDGQIWCRNNDH